MWIEMMCWDFAGFSRGFSWHKEASILGCIVFLIYIYIHIYIYVYIYIFMYRSHLGPGRWLSDLAYRLRLQPWRAVLG